MASVPGWIASATSFSQTGCNIFIYYQCRITPGEITSVVLQSSGNVTSMELWSPLGNHFSRRQEVGRWPLVISSMVGHSQQQLGFLLHVAVVIRRVKSLVCTKKRMLSLGGEQRGIILM